MKLYPISVVTYVSTEMYEALRTESRVSGVPVAELVRRALAAWFIQHGIAARTGSGGSAPVVGQDQLGPPGTG